MKRFFDVVVAGIGVVVLSPVMAIIACVVRVTSPGPAIFRQTRIGRGFVPFTILKFRTMVTEAPRMGPAITAGGDPRITPFGRLLRATKLDELPQLFNVLRGDMSLVGPRPEVPEYVELFRDEFAVILHVRPGITDPASIVYRDEGNLLQMVSDPREEYVKRILPRKLHLAREYCRRPTVIGDIGIIVRTLCAIAPCGRVLKG